MNFEKILSTAWVLLKSELFVQLQNPRWQTFRKIQTNTVRGGPLMIRGWGSGREFAMSFFFLALLLVNISLWLLPDNYSPLPLTCGRCEMRAFSFFSILPELPLRIINGSSLMSLELTTRFHLILICPQRKMGTKTVPLRVLFDCPFRLHQIDFVFPVILSSENLASHDTPKKNRMHLK